MDIKYDFKNICPVCRESLVREDDNEKGKPHIFLCKKESCRQEIYFKVSPIVLYYEVDQRGDTVTTSLEMMEINLSKYKVFFTAIPHASLMITIFDKANFILDLSKPLLTKWGKQKEEKDYRCINLSLEHAVHFDPDKPADELLAIIYTMLAFN